MLQKVENLRRDFSCYRKDFPVLDQEVHGHPLIYFDNAATTQKPRQVIDALRNYYERDNSNVHRGIHTLSTRATLAYEAARARAAEFIGASSPEEIVFTRGTTESLNLIAAAWGSSHLKEGDGVLLTEMEHHSNIVPWQLLAQRTGVKLHYLRINGDEGRLVLDDLADRLERDRIRLFALTHISNSLGTINPVAELCLIAREQGVLTVIDAAQSAGHMPLDVQEIGCDFLAFSGHKMCGPTGIGVLYGRRERLEETPPYQGGGEMISRVDLYESKWNRVPHKFEAGTPNIAGAIGLHAAMDYLDEIGRHEIASHDIALAMKARRAFGKIEGCRLFGPHGERGALVSFVCNDVHAHDFVTVADGYGIALRGGHHCNMPLMKRLGVAGTARASFCFYNTDEELENLLEAAQQIFLMFRT